MRIVINFDATCPKCKAANAAPPDVEPEDLFPCLSCAEPLVCKAIFEDENTVKSWLVTNASERALYGLTSTETA